MEFTTVANSVLIVSTAPIWVALLSPVIIKEQVTKPILIGLALAMVGVFIVTVIDFCIWQEGHSSYNLALGYLLAAYVSLNLLGELIATTLLAYFLLGETPSSVQIFGAILILRGIFIASRYETSNGHDLEVGKTIYTLISCTDD